MGGQDLGVEIPVDGVRNRTWVLDAGGRLRVVIQAVSRPDASPTELDELQAIIDSIRIDRTVPATPPPQPAGS